MPSIMTMAMLPSSSRNIISQQSMTVAESFAMSNGKLKPHSTPATLCWLEKNYELSDGVCIPRNVVYYNYTDFCQKNDMLPVNAASFGKVMSLFHFFFHSVFLLPIMYLHIDGEISFQIIRQMFQNLTTRRLGTRGQSRYHYYGLAIKPSSIYYTPSYSSRKYERQSMKFDR